MAIRKITYRGSKASRQCMECRYMFLFSDIDKAAALNKRIKCPECGTSIILQYGENGTVIATNTKHRHLLE